MMILFEVVKNENGEILNDNEQVVERWSKYFVMMMDG
jgi:hypothetical protein